MSTAYLQPAITPQLGEKRPLVQLNLLATFGFVSLCCCTMLNLNYFTRVFLKTEQVLSIFYLISCLTVIFALRFPIKASIGSAGVFWMFFIGFYLTISTRAGLGVDRGFFTSPTSNFYRILTAQLIIVSAAAGARHMMLAGKLQTVLRFSFAFMLLAALTILLAKIFPVLAIKSQQGRVGGVFSDANRAGHAICYTAAFGFAALHREKSFLVRMLMLGGIASLLPSLLITNSRSSIIFLVLLVMIQAMFTPLLKKKSMIIPLLVLAAGVPIGVLFMMNQQGSHVNAGDAADLEQQQNRLESFARILKGEMSEEDTGHRFVLAAVGLRYFFESPVIGAGFHRLSSMPEVNHLGCHNSFIKVFGEGGIFAGLLYVSSVAGLALASWRCRVPEIRTLGIGFTAMYACSAMVAHTGFTTRISNVCMGICFGLITAALTMRKQEFRTQRAAIWAQAAQLQQARALTAAN